MQNRPSGYSPSTAKLCIHRVTKGSHASAMIYSLIETAKANCLNVYKHFELLLMKMPKHMDDTNLDFIDDLLPWNPSVQQACPSRFKKS